MAKKGSRIIINLECSECRSINYTTQKNKQNRSEPLILKKFCKRCRKVTEHKEIKK